MHPDIRTLGRLAIDNRLRDIDVKGFFPAPASWVKAIREALGMTTRQFARRLGVSQPRIIALEKAEEKRTITLESLERAARALDCELVYALVPRNPLSKMVDDQAVQAATRLMAATRHTMALEAQSGSKADDQAQIRRVAKDMIARADKAIWETQ